MLNSYPLRSWCCYFWEGNRAREYPFRIQEAIWLHGADTLLQFLGPLYISMDVNFLLSFLMVASSEFEMRQTGQHPVGSQRGCLASLLWVSALPYLSPSILGFSSSPNLQCLKWYNAILFLLLILLRIQLDDSLGCNSSPLAVIALTGGYERNLECSYPLNNAWHFNMFSFFLCSPILNFRSWASALSFPLPCIYSNYSLLCCLLPNSREDASSFW